MSGIATTLAAIPTIVLVHGAFVDGSGWAGVHRILRDHGYPVVVLQHPTTSLADDVAATRRALAGAEGDVVLVGHSYGGVVITEAGRDPKVSALVYVAAFAPDQGESVASLLAGAPPDAPKPPILPPVDGFLTIDKARFAEAFAADVAPDVARFMADSQQAWGVQGFSGAVGSPAWKAKPSWYLVAQDDRMIPPDAQRSMAGRTGATVRSVPGSHAVFVSNPQVVAALIEEAARGRRTAERP
jgi:pimeloyl-ACP methyl ester carboxylesterase